ncbi:hypothetical protein E2C01_059872 [Portunus trituberculatus]|uniref:Uncharacterized protein n=1 Tax=Portunus trituberculatus TaxID=210409 RepID=A0A5B7H7T4_PORTR|nr:hypothetical protein [Portunus trituberculatus]
MNIPRHCLMNLPRHRLMKPHYCPEVGFTRPHSTQPEGVKLGLLDVSSRSRPQPVNTTPIGLLWGHPALHHCDAA